tara:strand:- start:196 stop:534 length:339 start_codon:yes stop_codon:yes gene_type:complete
MDKEEAKKFINDAYSQEEANWNHALNAWYRPKGAPGRLSEELLVQWHDKHRTGVVHPSDLPSHSIRIVYDEGRVSTVKHFTTRQDAMSYRNHLLTAGLCAVYINPYGEVEDE